MACESKGVEVKIGVRIVYTQIHITPSLPAQTLTQTHTHTHTHTKQQSDNHTTLKHTPTLSQTDTQTHTLIPTNLTFNNRKPLQINPT